LHVQMCSLDSNVSRHLAHWSDWYNSHLECSMSAVRRVPVRSLVTYDLKKLVLAVVKPDIGPPSTLKTALVAFQSMSIWFAAFFRRFAVQWLIHSPLWMFCEVCLMCFLMLPVTRV